MYGCEVWGFHNADAVEKIHTGFCKRILHLRKSTSNVVVYVELGRTPLKIDRYYKIIKYWLNMVTFKPNPLVFKIYHIESESVENGNNWSSLVFKLLCNLGFHDVWLAQGVANVRLFLALCKQRLYDQYIQEWQGKINDQSQTSLY